jgi:hypothetical protein
LHVWKSRATKFLPAIEYWLHGGKLAPVPNQIAAGEALVFAVATPTSLVGHAVVFCLGGLAPIEPLVEAALVKITVPGSETAKLKPGSYNWQLWDTGHHARVLASGKIAITPSLLQGHDARTYAEQTLAALKEAMLRLASEDEAQITIHGRAVTFKDPLKIQELIDRYQAIVNAQRESRGLIRTIPVRFK